MLAPVAVVALVVIVAPVASAHSFLVGTAPAQGDRLARSPSAVVLEFSETIDLSTASVALRIIDGPGIETGEPELGPEGLAVRASVPELADGIYVVSWEAFSAVDGHGTSGELAFAVGDLAGAVPAAVSGPASAWWVTAAGWVFFAGYAMSAGGLVFRRLAEPSTGPGPPAAHRAVRLGLVIVLAGTAADWVARPPGASLTSNLLALATIELAALALLLTTLTKRPLLPLAAILGAAATWSGRELHRPPLTSFGTSVASPSYSSGRRTPATNRSNGSCTP